MENNKELILSIKNIAKFFDTSKILKDISLDVYKGDVIAIIGPSGSGKSTFLRCINLLEEPTRGSLIYRERPISTSLNAKMISSITLDTKKIKKNTKKS